MSGLDIGFLTQEEYETVGRKKSPNFVGSRSEVYTLFLVNHHHMKKCNSLLLTSLRFLRNMRTGENKGDMATLFTLI